KHDLSNEMCASSDEEKAYMKKVPYASVVGSIMYAVRCTRLDVAFAQNLTTIAMHATQSEYMAASEAAMEAAWIRKFVGDLGVMPSINK
nr:putative Gag-Pol polyprotein [Tanacetum cinerariifolium]